MKQYETYRDSGIQWLGKIPSHWETIAMKFYFYMKGRIGWQGLKAEEFIEEGPYLVTGTDFEDGHVVWERCYHISEERYNEAPEIHVKKGDLLITKDGTVGKLAYIDSLPEKVSLNSHLLILRPNTDRISNHFMYWALQASNFEYYTGLAQNGSIMASLSQEKIGDYKLGLPTLDEQQTIASYLDYKVGQIDAAIKEKEALLEDLKSYRTAIISEAVTKGLDKNVELKDSRNEWIGLIPTHWNKCRIKHVISLLTDYDANGSFSDIAKNCNINKGKPFAWMVRATDLENRRYGIVPGNNYCDFETYKYLSKSSLSPEDILIAKRGDIGKSYIVPQCDAPMTLAPNTYLLITKKDIIHNWYLYFYLQSERGIENLRFLNKSTTLGALYKDDVKAMYIPLPPLTEQISIADAIRDKINEVDGTILEISLQIDDLKSYKSSVISEAVTGKVDLREWKCKTDNA